MYVNGLAKAEEVGTTIGTLSLNLETISTIITERLVTK